MPADHRSLSETPQPPLAGRSRPRAEILAHEPGAAETSPSRDRNARWADAYARWALGAAFLSGIASRFGLWGAGVGYGNFANFMRYTAQVNRFMPASTIPSLAWAATAAELILGLALVAGVWRRPVAIASAVLLALFALAMAFSFGPKEPLDYSVFSASACALLLALSREPRVARGGVSGA